MWSPHGHSKIIYRRRYMLCIYILHVICVSSPTVFFSDRVYRFYICMYIYFRCLPIFSFFLSTLESFNTTQWLTTFCRRLMTRRIVHIRSSSSSSLSPPWTIYLFIHKRKVYVYNIIYSRRMHVVFFNCHEKL